MPSRCSVVATGEGGFAIVCQRGVRRTPKCWNRGCARDGAWQCDGRTTEGKTCDRWLCWKHRHPAGLNVDYCSEHAKQRELFVEGEGKDHAR